VFADILGARAGLLVLFATTLAGVGCTVEAGTSAPPILVEPGRLTVRWTVSGRVDPNLCVIGRAAAIDIAVSTLAGGFAGEFQAPCTAFATTISSLYPGDYVADALLIDPAGLARTTTVQISPFTILDRTELIVDVDFPADSFFDGITRDAIGGAAGATPNGARPEESRDPPSGTRQSAPPAGPSAAADESRAPTLS
jgi:hypothetical protein